MSIPASLSNLEGNHLDRMDVMVLLDLIGAKNPTFMSTQVQNNDVVFNVTLRALINSYLRSITHYHFLRTLIDTQSLLSNFVHFELFIN